MRRNPSAIRHCSIGNGYRTPVWKIEYLVLDPLLDELVAVGVASKIPVLVNPLGHILNWISAEGTNVLAQLQNLAQRAADCQLAGHQAIHLNEALIEENEPALGIKHQQAL